MKSFFKDFAKAIPLALGIVLTIFSVVNAIEVLNEQTAGLSLPLNHESLNGCD